jgi:large subunit ribosomal protein L30
MKLKVTLRRSGVSRPERQRDTLRGLGLTRISQTRVLNDTPAIRGMLAKVGHLVEWEQVEERT